jgi:hypothetical protein
VNRPKRIGTDFENAVVDCLHGFGFVGAERRALAGTKDRGDIAGVPGVVIDAKNWGTYDIPGWLRELDAEVANADARTGAVWVKQRGKASAEHGYIITRPALWLPLL